MLVNVENLWDFVPISGVSVVSQTELSISGDSAMVIKPKETCLVNNALLVEDRKSRGLKQEDLVDDGKGAFSLASLRRAEKGGARLERRTLREIAKALGREDLDYYVIQEAAHGISSPQNLSGEWRAYYVERSPIKEPYLVEERLMVRQSGLVIRGIYTCLTYERQHEFAMEGRIYNNTVFGTYQVLDRTTAEGLGCFQLIVGRAADWLEGYCTWIDYDSMIVECSKNIWLRYGAYYFDEHRSDVEQKMNKETDIAVHRKEYEL